MSFHSQLEGLKGKTENLPLLGISEIVLKTDQFDELRAWYQIVLGAEPFYVREKPEKPSWTGAMGVAFFRLHGDFPYKQIFAVFEIPGTGDMPGRDPGIHHIQLKHGSLEELFDRYERLKACGITPVQTWNHGPGTSFYYEDPDGNHVEMSGANFDNEKEYLAYFETDGYRRNISGIEIDVEDYVGRFRAGVSKAELVKIPADA